MARGGARREGNAMKVSFELNPRVVARWVIGGLLLWAALGKLANLQEFYASLLAYQLPVPRAGLRGVAVVLPWIELLCGLLLVANLRPGAALAWTVVLFAVFAVCTGQAWLRGLEVTCGCLDLRLVGISAGSKVAAVLESVKFAFVRALVLGAVALFLYRSEVSRPAPR